MSRRLKHGKRLRIHKGSGQWTKVIDGKQWYFGAAGKTKREQDRSYPAAERRLDEHLQKLELKKVQEQVAERLHAVGTGTKPVNALGSTVLEQEFLQRLLQGGDVDASGYVVQEDPEPTLRDRAAQVGFTVVQRDGLEYVLDQNGDEVDEEALDDPMEKLEGENLRLGREVLRLRRLLQDHGIDRHAPPAATSGHPTIAVLAERWLAEEQLRLKPQAFRSMKAGIKPFVGLVGKQRLGDAKHANQLVLKYKEWGQQQLIAHQAELERVRAAGKPVKAHGIGWAPDTYLTKAKFLRQFFVWLVDTVEVLDKQPGALKHFSKGVQARKSRNPLEPEQVRKLWVSLEPRWKCFVAIGLNCGFKNSDIAGLTGDMLADGRLLGHRGKTGVAMNYKLWPLTQALIAEVRDNHGADDPVFVDKRDRPLKTETFSKAFTYRAQKAGVDCTFDNLRDTGAELLRRLVHDTPDSTMDQVSEYLAHKVTLSTDENYLSNHPEEARSPRLDRLTDKLFELLALEQCPDQSARGLGDDFRG